MQLPLVPFEVSQQIINSHLMLANLLQLVHQVLLLYLLIGVSTGSHTLSISRRWQLLQLFDDILLIPQRLILNRIRFSTLNELRGINVITLMALPRNHH